MDSLSKPRERETIGPPHGTFDRCRSPARALGDRAYLHYGGGRSQAAKALQATGIDPEMKAKDLTDDQTLALRDWIEQT